MLNFKMSPVPDLLTLEDIPLGSSCPAFHITEKNAGWRVFRPVLDASVCVGCFRCYLVCPEGAIARTDEGAFVVDYDFCKGCGLCARECRRKAIAMIKEAEA